MQIGHVSVEDVIEIHHLNGNHQDNHYANSSRKRSRFLEAIDETFWRPLVSLLSYLHDNEA
jgi:hypothetical protein